MVKLINKLKNRKGFTLIELIVVLAVLAIIMAIAVPRFIGVQTQAKIDADYTTVANIAKAAELYYARNNETVPTIALLKSNGYIESGSLKLQSTNVVIKDMSSTLDENGETVITVSGSGGVSVDVYSSGAKNNKITYPDNR